MANMRAARIVSYDAPLVVEKVEEPKLIPGSVIVNVDTVYIPTYTNLVFGGKHKYIWNLPELPTIPGICAIGHISDIAENVFDLAKGQAVFFGNLMSSNDPASKDDSFFIGWTTVGPHSQRLQKIYKEGALAEKTLLPSSGVIPLPEALTSQYSLSQLGVLSFIGIAYGALKRGEFKAGDVVIVNGATGLLGSSAVILALACGASRVIAVGRDAATLESLRSIDPKRVFPVSVSSSIEEDAKKIKALGAEADYPKNEGAHILIDLIGMTKADITLACIKALRRRGIAVLVGGVPEMTINYSYVMVKQIELRGSFMYTMDEFGEMIRLVASGILDLNKFKVAAFSLEQVNEAIAQASNTKDWVVVDMHK